MQVLSNSAEHVRSNRLTCDLTKYASRRDRYATWIKVFVCLFNASQKCNVRGVVRLWVRAGEVRLFGAHISESPKTYTIFAPFRGTSVQILSTSKSAEFQLESLSLLNPALPSPISVPDVSDRWENNKHQSFQFVDKTKTFEIQHPTSTEHDDYDLGSEAQKIIAKQLKEASGDSYGQRRILICGKQSSKTVAASIACINYVLSTSELEKISAGVGFLDLNPISPAFACPGTISAATFRDLILGPSHAQPLQINKSWNNALISSFYVDSDQQSNNTVPDLNLVEKLLQLIQRSKHTILVIRVGRWFSTVPEQILVRLKNTINPNMVLSVDQSRTSESSDAALLMSRLMSVEIVRQPSFRSTPASALVAHKLSLLSHYRLHGYVGASPLWYSFGRTVSDLRNLELSFMSASSGVNFIITCGGSLRPQDIPEVLRKAMVMIVARAENGNPAQRAPTVANMNEPGHSYELHHVGIAQAQSIDEVKETIVLNTPVTLARLTEVSAAGLQIGLVLQRPSMDGWFDHSLLDE